MNLSRMHILIFIACILVANAEHYEEFGADEEYSFDDECLENSEKFGILEDQVKSGTKISKCKAEYNMVERYYKEEHTSDEVCEVLKKFYDCNEKGVHDEYNAADKDEKYLDDADYSYDDREDEEYGGEKSKTDYDDYSEEQDPNLNDKLPVAIPLRKPPVPTDQANCIVHAIHFIYIQHYVSNGFKIEKCNFLYDSMLQNIGRFEDNEQFCSLVGQFYQCWAQR